MTARPSPGWLRICQLILVICGLSYGIFGLSCGFFYSGTVGLDPTVGVTESVLFAVLGALVALGLCVAVALINFIAAVGLIQRQPWGRFLTIAIGVFYTPSGCFPLGLILLYGMFQPNTRAIFLAAAKDKEGE